MELAVGLGVQLIKNKQTLMSTLSSVGDRSLLLKRTWRTPKTYRQEHEQEETFPAEALSLWEDDVNGAWFLTKRLGSKEKTVQFRENSPETKAWRRLLDRVFEKVIGARKTKLHSG